MKCIPPGQSIEQPLARVSNFYKALVQCDQAIIRSTSANELFTQICDDIVQLGRMKSAWVGMIEAGDQRVRPVAFAGDGMGYLESIEISVDPANALGLGPSGTAIREDRPIWCQDILLDPATLPWRAPAQEMNWCASAALPLRRAGVPVGVLSMYSDEVNAFDELARDLLIQMASNISYALEFFDTQKQRQQAESALRESEKLYSTLFASSIMPMLLIDPQDGRIVDANLRAQLFYGWDHATLLSMCIMDINVLSPEQIKAEMALALSTHKSYFDFRHRLCSGEVREVEVFTGPARVNDRNLLLTTVHDVSERRQAEARLRQVQALTQRFIDQLPGSVYLKDSQLRLLMVNQGLGVMLGVDPQTLIGKTNYDIFPSDFAATITELDQQLLEQGGSQTVEEEFNGRHFETNMFVMDDESGERLLGGLSQDVTERFHAGELTRALLRINELGATQLPEKDFLTVGLELAEKLTGSAIGFLHFINDDQETLELVTWTFGALKGCTAAHDAHYPISQAGIWADCFRQRRPVVFNDYANFPNKIGLPVGHTVLTRLISVPVIEGDNFRMMLGVGNKPTDYVSADVDALQLIGNDLWRIIRRARAEIALQQRVEELVTVNQKLTQIQLQLLQSEKMASIGQLAAGVAHEINNPIGFVKSNFGAMTQYVDDLLGIAAAYAQVEQQLGEPFAHAFKQVQQCKQAADHNFLMTDLPQLIRESREGVDRVSKIVQDLKDFSRAGDSDWQWSDLHKGLESTIGVAWNQLKYKADVIREYGTLPDVYCLVSQINQVVLNLLVNAAQAIPVHGHITIRTGTEGPQVWIEVHDDGCGIDAQHLARIFEPFYTSKPVGQGTGLGLSIAWSIVERHHGKILVDSDLHRGTTFKVILPIDFRSEVKDAAE